MRQLSASYNNYKLKLNDLINVCNVMLWQKCESKTMASLVQTRKKI